uniref:EF-hand domain-containing protein n=1 Tax=Haptolina ericina TaxID=156174 RepID=A0A7S3F0P1_9EUKA
MKLPGLKDSANLKASALSPIEYFHAIDTDGNGQLSLRELTAALKVNHMSREAIRAIFDTCDRDKSGSISLIEWMRMTKEKGELLPSKLERPPAFISAVAPMDLFAEMDKDGSGSISRGEFSHALTDRFMSAGTIDRLFKEVDVDNSGEISMLEWSRAVKKFPELTSTGRPSAFAEYLSPMEYFAWMDKDCSGTVTKAELGAALKKSNMSPKAVDMIFQRVDADGNGEVTMLEWANAVKACPELLPEKLGMPSADPNLADHIVTALTLGIVRKKP